MDHYGPLRTIQDQYCPWVTTLSHTHAHTHTQGDMVGCIRAYYTDESITICVSVRLQYTIELVLQ